MQRIKLSSVKSNVLYSLIATAMEHFQEQLHAPRATSQSNLFKFKYQFLFLQIMRVCVAQPSSYPASKPHTASHYAMHSRLPWRVWQSVRCGRIIVNNVPNLQIAERHVACVQHSRRYTATGSVGFAGLC